MKILLLLVTLSTLLLSRENPFDSPFQRAKTVSDIPLVTIKKREEVAKPIKVVPTKIAKPTPKIVEITVQPQPRTFLLPPIIIDETPIVNCCITKPKIKKTRKKRVKKVKRKSRKFKIIYKNYFLKISTNDRSIKIYTKDCLLKKSVYKNPKRVVLDFKRLQHFNTKSIKISNSYIKQVSVGSHNCFYRVTINETKKTDLRVKKTNYGYLIY